MARREGWFVAQLFYEEIDLPCKTMFGILTSFPRLQNNTLAPLLFREDFSYGGRLLVDRFSERTFLSRQIVDAKPGQWSRRAFKDFIQSSQAVASRIVGPGFDRQAVSSALALFTGEAADAMAKSLEHCGIDSTQFRNMVSRIDTQEGVKDLDKLSATLVLFLATGCTCEVPFAVSEAEGYFQKMLNMEYRTAIEQPGTLRANMAAGLSSSMKFKRLGLMRVLSDGSMKHSGYPLSTDPDGTVIGRFPGEESSGAAITDVDSIVSRRHLRIWRDDSFDWYAEGLGSTNGSKLTSGEDGTETVIEPPAKERTGFSPQPVRLLPGDIVSLADKTKFVVIALPE